MLQLVVDLYPEDNAFYVHIQDATPPENKRNVNTILRQWEWNRALKVSARLSKHLRRIGMIDRSIPRSTKEADEDRQNGVHAGSVS